MGLIGKLIAAGKGIILSITICALILGLSLVLSLVLDPRGRSFGLSVAITAFMAFSMVFFFFWSEFWENDKPQTSHIIVGNVLMWGVLMAFPLVLDLLSFFLFSKEVTFPPIEVIMTALGGISLWIWKRVLPPRVDHGRPLWTENPSSIPGPAWKPPNKQVTTHYNKDGNYAGTSFSSGDHTTHYDKEDKYTGTSYKK
jgi:hypothetical protein